MYEVELIEEAEADFAALGPSLRRRAEAQMRKLKHHPYAGEPLGHKAGYDLTGYRAIAFAGKRYRIVYKVDEKSELVTVIWLMRSGERGGIGYPRTSAGCLARYHFIGLWPP